jgi:sulfite reductase (NADPH) flavoprotein alpha-component
MIISVWRYSHMLLAVFSFVFLALASLTGIILAFEPLAEKSKGFRSSEFDQLDLAQVIPALKNKYPGIQELNVDDNDYVIISYINKAGNTEKAYVNPASGEWLGTPGEKPQLFQWTTNLHRSLFLHETGRLIVGVCSFLLILVAVSGFMLVIQRQKGIKRFFSPVEHTGFLQYYHVVFGRFALLFILAIALTGSYLSLARFGIVESKNEKPEVNIDTIREEPHREIADFTLFKQTPLSTVKTVQFPFSEFPEDYFNLKLKNREVSVNQFSGEPLAQVEYSRAHLLSEFSLRWHTGRSNALWAVLLAIASAYILFFIYSGLMITWKRRSARLKNKYEAADCRIIILVGSENGSSFRFAGSIYRQLLSHGEKVYLTDLNNYTVFPKAEHLIIMTGTYGLGDPPSNAKLFATRLRKYPQPQQVHFSVVGFGSRSYPEFCRFAFDADHLLRQQTWAIPFTDIITVNDRSPQDFSDWLTAWSQRSGLHLTISRELLTAHHHGLKKLKVVHKTRANENDSFLIRLKPTTKARIVSGDLIAIYPKNDHRERLYSVGRLGNEIQLTVKLHPKGMGSGFLHALKAGDQIQGRLVKNQHFHFPRKATQVVMISNGTGIAPFLGMIDQNTRGIACTLYCGFRTQSSFELYREFLADRISSGRLTDLHLALSREGEKKYVIQLISRDRESIYKTLTSGGILMICGSLSMEKDVMDLLEKICKEHKGSSAGVFRLRKQILSDCY